MTANKEQSTIQMEVVERFPLQNLLELEPSVRHPALEQFREALVQQLDSLLQAERELVEKRREVLYDFSCQLFEVQHELLNLIPKRDQSSP